MPTGKGYGGGGSERVEDGIATGGMSKYDATNAPVVKNGGSDAIHDGVETSGPSTKNSKRPSE